MFGGNLDLERREDLFFWSSPDNWGNLDVGRREDLLFWSSPNNWGNLDVGRREDVAEMCLTVCFKFQVITFKT